MPITIPTLLKMCKCGRHGFFVSGGAESDEFASKEDAREILRRLHEQQVVDEHEMKFLQGCISEQGRLADNRGDENLMVLFACRIKNTLKMAAELDEDEGENEDRPSVH